MIENNSYFTDLMITKDTSGNADFIFGVDMDRMALGASPYSDLIKNMTDVAKRQVASNNEILSFNIDRRHVKEELSLNSLGSALMPEVFSNETMSHQVIGSIGEMREVPITMTGIARGIKYLTASDLGLAGQTAGTYQYSLFISIIDGFIPTINKLLKRLYRTSNDVSNYLAALDRAGKRVPIAKTKTDEMSKTYVDALSYFKNLTNINVEYTRASSLIAFRSQATKESIGIFQNRLNSVISKTESLISKTGTNTSPSSVANKSANSGLTNVPTIEIYHSFNKTVRVESTDNRFVDFFGGKGTIGGGLNTYSNTEVKNTTPETIYLETPMTSLQALEARGITFIISPISFGTIGVASTQNIINTDKYIGPSAIATNGLLRDSLSPIDLSTVNKGSLVSTEDINVAVLSMAPKHTSDMKAIQTMVLVTMQTSDPAMLSMTSMLKSPEWKPIDDVINAAGTILLCKQEDDSLDVANGFFLMETI